jgi:hypothetical protein
MAITMMPRRSASLLTLVLCGLVTLGACDDPTGLTTNPTARVTVGDTVEATIEPGGEPYTFSFDAEAGDSIAVFLHATAGAVSLAVLAPDASSLATVADTGRQGSLEERGSRPFHIRLSGTHIVRVAALGAAGASFRFRLWALRRDPEHRPAAIALGDTIRGEDLETPADVDEFTFQGQQGDELIAYVRALAPHPRAVVSMALFRDGKDPWDGVAAATSDTIAADLEARPTGRFILTQTGLYRIRVQIHDGLWGAGQVAGYPRGYELQLRRIVRAPERALGTITPGDTLATEAIDYVGDIDEFSVAAPAGGQFNVFLERSGTGPGPLTVSVDGSSDPWLPPTATANPPGAPLLATATGGFTIPAGGTGRIRVMAGDREKGYRGPYRIFLYPVNLSSEIAGTALVLGDSITSETIELAGDVDEFTLTVPEETLANFVLWRDGTETTDFVRLQLFDRNSGERVTIVETWRGEVFGDEGYAAGTFELAAGTYRLHVSGGDTRGFGFRGAYRVHTLAIDPDPESVPAALAFGDTVLEAVEPLGDEDIFTFSGRLTEHVGVRVESVSSEPLPNLSFIVRNPRTTAILNAGWYEPRSMRRYDLPEAGEYTLEVRAMNGGRLVREHGPYRLILDTLSTAPEHHGTVVVPGDSLLDELLDFTGDIDAYVLTGTPGEELTLTFVAPGWAYLDLFDLDTRVRVDGTTTAGSLQNAGRFALPSSGKLGMRVYGGVTGLYRIAVRRIDRRPEVVSAQIEIDSIIDGEAIDPDADIDEFTFNAVAGDRVNVYFQTPLGVFGWEGLVLELIDTATGAILGSVRSINPTQRLDEQGTGPIALPSTGTYTVHVRGGMDWYGRGQYRLQVKRLP